MESAAARKYKTPFLILLIDQSIQLSTLTTSWYYYKCSWTTIIVRNKKTNMYINESTPSKGPLKSTNMQPTLKILVVLHDCVVMSTSYWIIKCIIALTHSSGSCGEHCVFQHLLSLRLQSRLWPSKIKISALHCCHYFSVYRCI